MNKIFLVIQREYATRVRKPSFWVLTLVVPILLAGLYAVPIVMATRPLEHTNVLVADETGLFAGEFQSGRDITYLDAGSLDYAKRQLAEVDSIDAIVYIPARESTIPYDAFLYYRTNEPSATAQSNVDRQLQEILRNRILLDVHGITPEDYAMLTGTHIKMHTKDIETGRDGFLTVKTVVGIVLVLLVFMAVFLFGSQVMRGVMEEKTNRIVEVIVCSVKPFQLMMGKVVGIGLVGLTQFALWVLLSAVAVGGLQLTNSELFRQTAESMSLEGVATKGTEAVAQMEAARNAMPANELMQGLASIDFGLLGLVFVFYFVFGYLLYASLFAAMGSLVDNETDSQQFTIPVTAPLIMAMLMLPAMIDAPSGSLSVWLSLIPFTSPVAMMLRIPFGVPVWQLALSAVLLLLTFPACIWAAGRIYRAGILRYGQKTTWHDVWRFLSRGDSRSK